MAAAEGKTLVFEAGKTYKFGTYVRSNGWGSQWRIQGIHLKTRDVVIEGNGATIEWDDPQVFVGNDGLALEGTKENPIRDIVIRNLNFKAKYREIHHKETLTEKAHRKNRCHGARIRTVSTFRETITSRRHASRERKGVCVWSEWERDTIHHGGNRLAHDARQFETKITALRVFTAYFAPSGPATLLLGARWQCAVFKPIESSG